MSWMERGKAKRYKAKDESPFVLHRYPYPFIEQDREDKEERLVKNIIVIVCVVSVMVCGVVPGYAQHLNEETTYSLLLPAFLGRDEDYDAPGIWPYEVKVSYLNGATFLVQPVSEDEQWVNDLEERNFRGWVGTVKQDGAVEISGVIILGNGGGYILVELTGTFVAEDTLKGQAVRRIGDEPPDFPYVYHCEWGLVPVEREDSLEISLRVTYHGPRVIIKAVSTSPWEMAQRPVNSDLGIKDLAGEEPHARDRFYKGIPQGRKVYYDNLLTEFAWEEIPYIPGILLLIDHLVTVDEEIKQKIAEGYVRDGSLHVFDPIPYEDLQQVPPLFLILYVLEKMPEDDIVGLQEVSPRFVTMLDAYKTIPPEELADLPVLEFMIKISEQLPEEFRGTSFQQSPKLWNYVAASEDKRLKELYPFSE